MPLKSITRFFALAPLFLIPFFPLIVENSFFFPFITGKAFYFRTLVEIAFAAWVVLACLDARYRPKWNSLTVGVTIFALVTLVADLVGVNPLRSLWSNFERMEGWLVVIHLWMFYMVTVHTFGIGEAGLSAQAGKKLWHNWLNTSLVASAIVGCYGFAQYVGWATIHQGSTRIDASLGNAEYMAVYMLISIGFALYLLFESKNRRALAVLPARYILSGLEWTYAVLAIAFSFLLIETGTRGTTFALIGAVLLTLLLYAIFGKKENKTSRIVAGGIIIAIGLVGALFWAERDSTFVQHSPALSRIASISLNDISTSGRAYIWPMAIKGAMERPILGWGQENFNYVFNANYNPKMYGQEQWFDRAHSVYLDWLIAGGLVGLLAYLSLYVLFLLAVWKSQLAITEKSLLTGLLAGYAIHNFFVFDNLASYVLFFALLGLGASLGKSEIRNPRSEERTGEGKSEGNLNNQISKPPWEISRDVVEYVVLPLAIVALVFGIYVFNVRAIQENTRLITALQACSGGNTASLPDPSLFEKSLAPGAYLGDQEIREQLLSCATQVLSAQQIPNPTKQAFFVMASQQIDAQIAATPQDARVYTLGGSFYEQIGAFSQAVGLLEKAHALSPDKQSISLVLATAYINLQQYDKALALSKKTYESETSDIEARNAYITTLIVSGHDDEAQKLFGSDQSLFETEQIAQAYSIAKKYDKAIAIYQSIVGTSTDKFDVQFKMAQTQYAAGRIYEAVETLKAIEKAHPEYTSQIEAAIKQVQK